MRLNKFIAQSGLASRRKAEEYIEQGRVKINGVTMTNFAYSVTEGDVVEIDGRVIRSEAKKVYYVLNKPVGYITSAADEKGRPTVLGLVKDIEERVFPVGRLDYNTSGLIVMTNDGDLAYKLTHPKHHVYKTYRAVVQGLFTEEKANRLRKGVDIGGFITSKAIVKIEKQLDRSSIIEIKIFEGKNRQVRKMFSQVGHKVVELERTAIGDINLGRLKTGHYRKLSKSEIDYLKNC